METTTAPEATDEMCEYCEDNPAEPNLPCCANSHCVREYYRDCEAIH